MRTNLEDWNLQNPFVRKKIKKDDPYQIILTLDLEASNSINFQPSDKTEFPAKKQQ